MQCKQVDARTPGVLCHEYVKSLMRQEKQLTYIRQKASNPRTLPEHTLLRLQSYGTTLTQ